MDAVILTMYRVTQISCKYGGAAHGLTKGRNSLGYLHIETRALAESKNSFSASGQEATCFDTVHSYLVSFVAQSAQLHSLVLDSW